MLDVTGMLCVCLAILLFAAFVIWAINDAQRRRKSAVLVCIAVVFFFPFRWIAWLLFRPPLEEQSLPHAR